MGRSMRSMDAGATRVYYLLVMIPRGAGYPRTFVVSTHFRHPPLASTHRKVVASIKKGIVVLVGIGRDDTPKHAQVC